jgi:predicted metal-dependent hydrolase
MFQKVYGCNLMRPVLSTVCCGQTSSLLRMFGAAPAGGAGRLNLSAMRRLLQFTLGLLDTTPPAPGPVAQHGGPLAQVQIAQSAIETVASAPPSQFRHPEANREVQLPGALVAYAFRRAKRRSIGFRVGPQGLEVSAPRWVPLAGVDAAVRDKGGWIVQKLGEARLRQAAQQALRIVWRDGSRLPYLGQWLTLALVPSQRGSRLAGDVLQLGLPLDASAEQICNATHKWWLAQARVLFAERLNHFAPQLQVQWQRLALTNAATRWGSASSTGAIRLNWRLLHHRMAVLDYVVVHELSHLRHMDHSPQFWATVASILPGYALERAELRNLLVPKWTD